MKIRTLTSIKNASLITLFGLYTSLPLCGCETKELFEQAASLLSNRNYDEASSILDQARACPPQSPLESFQLGWFYGRARHFEKALGIFAKIPRNVPDPMTHDYAVALSQFELLQYQRAIDVLKPDQTLATFDAKAANLLAVAYSKLDFYTDAYSVLSEQLLKDPNALTTHLNLITICAEGGDFHKAQALASDARKRFPASADVPILQGAIAEQFGHSTEALADFSFAASLAPSRGDARFFMALVNYKEGRYQNALSVLHDAADAGIADSDLHYLTAECLLKIDAEDSRAALYELNRAIEIDALSVSAHTLRGKLLLDKGRANDAVSDLELAYKQDPDSRTALYNLARAYRALGRAAEAQALFKQLHGGAPDTASEFANSRLNGVFTGVGSQ